jgi:hypothetical protein
MRNHSGAKKYEENHFDNELAISNMMHEVAHFRLSSAMVLNRKILFLS